MSTFALDASNSPADIIAGLNYALANLDTNNNLATAANVLTANITTGQITTTSTNSGGYSSSTIVSYLYRYMNVKYANSATGGSGFSGNCTMSNYYGLRNTSNSTVISSNPTDYSWYQVTGGFGTTKNLWYATVGGRQVDFFPGTTAPQVNYAAVIDDTAIDLDSITAAAGNQVVVVDAYLRANTQPATPVGGTYDFSTFTLYPPVGWSASVPAGSDPVYITQAAFSGTVSSNVAPQTTWAYPTILSSNFGGNTGPEGQRGFIPMGFVLTTSDPTGYSDYQYTTDFSASRTNSVPPIGVGYTPITGDTAQFLYANILSPSNSIGVVKTFSANTSPQWQSADGQVISGNVMVTGTISASKLNVNDVYAIDIQSTNASMGNISSAGYWLQANTGNARFAGNLNVGDNLTVGANATIGQKLTISSNLTVGANATIGNNLTVGANAYIGQNLTVSANAYIGDNLTVGANAYIGQNLTIANVLTLGTLNSNVVGSTQIQPGSITTGKIAANAVTAGTISANAVTAGTIAANAVTAGTIAAGAITADTIGANVIYGNSIIANTFTANTINGNAIVAGSLTLTGNINSADSVVGDYSAPGYWLQYNDGSARFGGNVSIGNNLTVANLITTGALNANIITTNQLVVNSATQTITAADNTSYPIIQFVNGSTNNPLGAGYLWPYFTRGFAIGGGATLTTTTNGSVTGSKIMVNYNAYLYSATNNASNVIELWKSGASAYYRNTFRQINYALQNPAFSGQTLINDVVLIAGDNGSIYRGNIGNVSQIVTGTTVDYNTVSGSTDYAASTASGTFAQYIAWGNNGAFFKADGSATRTGNLVSAGAAVNFNLYGSNMFKVSTGTTARFAELMVGSGGSILRGTMFANTTISNTFVTSTSETSGVYADLYDLEIGVAANAITSSTNVNYVAVGTAGTILYNTRTYNVGTSAETNGNVATSTGWSTATSNTINNLNAVKSNWSYTSAANVWIAVGDKGTILYNNGSTGVGPWLAANVVPTTQNLQGIGYINGNWVAVGDAGTIITSTDGNVWTGPIANPADGVTVSSNGVRNLYDVEGLPSTKLFVAVGEEIIMTSNSSNPSGGWNSNIYLGGSSTNSTLTRLQYFGSWANVANVSTPPTNQQVTNGQVVSGTYTDINYSYNETLTYYLVLGNMAGNVVITTNGPNMTVTEFKR